MHACVAVCIFLCFWFWKPGAGRAIRMRVCARLRLMDQDGYGEGRCPPYSGKAIAQHRRRQQYPLRPAQDAGTGRCAHLADQLAGGTAWFYSVVARCALCRTAVPLGSGGPTLHCVGLGPGRSGLRSLLRCRGLVCQWPTTRLDCLAVCFSGPHRPAALGGVLKQRKRS